MLVLPGLLSVTQKFDLDGDLRQAGSRFFAFNAGFLLVAGLSTRLLSRFGARPLSVAGLSLTVISTFTLVLKPFSISFWWELLCVLGIGVAAGAVSIASLSALKPWSGHSGSLTLPRVAELSCLGCVFSSLLAGSAYALDRGRYSPMYIGAGALLCLLFCASGRQPLAAVEKRGEPADAKTQQLRSIASFLLLALLFVQLGSEWSVAAWLPLFLIHRLGSGPVAAIFFLTFYFAALLAARSAAHWLAGKSKRRTIASSGAVLAVVGCVTLSVSASTVAVLTALLSLSAGFAPPYSIVRNILDESLHLAPSFYRAILPVAVSGAMCTAWLLGYVYQFFGMWALPLFPAAGSALVLGLELLLLFETHLMAERPPAHPGHHAVDRRTS